MNRNKDLKKKLLFFPLVFLFFLNGYSQNQNQIQATIGSQFIQGFVTDKVLVYPYACTDHNNTLHYVYIPSLTLYVDGSGSGPSIYIPDYFHSQHYGYARIAPLGDAYQQYSATNPFHVADHKPTFTFTPQSTDLGNPTSVQEIMTGSGSCNDGNGNQPKQDQIFNTFTISVEYPHFVNDSQLRNLCTSSPVIQISDYFEGNNNLQNPVLFFLDQDMGQIPNAAQVKSIDPSKLSPGNHTLIAWKSYDNGIYQQTIPIHVITTTPIVLGAYPSSICSNQGIFNISASPTGGTWSSTPSGAVDANGNVDPSKASAGAISLKYSYTDPNLNSNPSGCTSSALISLQVTQPPLPALISGNTQGCSGTPTLLTAHSDSTIEYDWYHLTDQTPFATGSSIHYTIQSTETLYCVAIGKNGCGLTRNASGSVQITSLSPTAHPSESESSIPFGGIVRFMAGGPTHATSYLWNFGDNESSPEENPSHYYYHSGTFKPTLYLTSTEGCSSLITLPLVTVSQDDSAHLAATNPRPTGTDSIPPGVRVYPSPFTDILYIAFKLKTPQPVHYQFMDVLGRIVLTGVLDGQAGDNKFKLTNEEHLSRLSHNTYYLVILKSAEIDDLEKVLKL